MAMFLTTLIIFFIFLIALAFFISFIFDKIAFAMRVRDAKKRINASKQNKEAYLQELSSSIEVANIEIQQFEESLAPKSHIKQLEKDKQLLEQLHKDIENDKY